VTSAVTRAAAIADSFAGRGGESPHALDLKRALCRLRMKRQINGWFDSFGDPDDTVADMNGLCATKQANPLPSSPRSGDRAFGR
jgi:hypothetical protein